MLRRDLLLSGLGLATAAALPPTAGAAEPTFAPRPGAWRRFEVVTRVVLPAGGPAQAWVPLPSLSSSDWLRPLGDDWTSDGGAVRASDAAYGATLVHASWKAGDRRSLEVRSRFESRDRAVDLAASGQAEPLSDAERRLYTAPTSLIPTDGIVRETAERIVGSLVDDRAKALAIYGWVVENTFRRASVRGCGTGNVAHMLTLGDLGGKCADINALFVGLSRAAGIPARDLYGIRVGPSAFGYGSLGPRTADVTKAQHCRAEIHLDGLGWVPADPADVRKVALEEQPGDLPLTHPKVVAARAALFGSWEGNWLPYNTAHDVALPGSAEGPVGFLMYPEAEIAGMRLDCLDPERFAYTIMARELAPA